MADFLVIEDDDGVRNILSAMIESFGHRVRTAENGEDGLERFREHPTPFVVTDLLMPRMEGLETMQELRTLRPDVRILAISGGGTALTAIGCLELARSLGANEVLSKPFSKRDLDQAVTNLIAAS